MGVWLFLGCVFQWGLFGFFWLNIKTLFFFLLVGYFLQTQFTPTANLSHLLLCRIKKVFPSIIWAGKHKDDRDVKYLYILLDFFSCPWHGDWSNSDTFISFHMRVSRERMLAIAPLLGGTKSPALTLLWEIEWELVGCNVQSLHFTWPDFCNSM